MIAVPYYFAVPYTHVIKYNASIVLGCNTGTYGLQCNKKCDHCKNNNTCDIDTGECDNLGCALAGFEPNMCNSKYNKQVNVQFFLFLNVLVRYISFMFTKSNKHTKNKTLILLFYFDFDEPRTIDTRMNPQDLAVIQIIS